MSFCVLIFFAPEPWRKYLLITKTYILNINNNNVRAMFMTNNNLIKWINDSAMDLIKIPFTFDHADPYRLKYNCN